MFKFLQITNVVGAIAGAMLFTACATTYDATKNDSNNSDSLVENTFPIDDKETNASATPVKDSDLIGEVQTAQGTDSKSADEKVAAAVGSLVSESSEGTKIENEAAIKGEDLNNSEVDSNGPFYTPKDGETIQTVAFGLYGDKSYAKAILEKNPGLTAGSKLSSDQKIYFDVEKLNPRPQHLSKEFLGKYKTELAEKVNANAEKEGLVKTTVAVKKGDTLQSISERNFGTSRMWAEIYLLNHDKIASFDKLKEGTELSIYQRKVAGISHSKQKSLPREVKPVVVAEKKKVNTQTDEQATAKLEPMDTQKVPATDDPFMDPVREEVTSQVAQDNTFVNSQVTPHQNEKPMGATNQPNKVQAPTQMAEAPAVVNPVPVNTQKMDPIPDMAKSVPAPAPQVVKKPVPAETFGARPGISSESAAGESNNFRRIIYIVMILTIAGIAFFLTRGGKKAKIDILDVTNQNMADMAPPPGPRKVFNPEPENKDVG